MAVTNNKKQEELARSTQPVGSATPYTGLAGVNQNTANNLGNYQQGYKQGERVTAAQQTLQNIQAQRPQAYTSRYKDQMDSIMQQIQNPKEFKYEFNGDNLFKSYADLYNQYAKQGMQDAMGAASALTGGYGNSYAQMVGQQQYQQNMLPLYEKGLELYDRAYRGYQDQLGNLRDNYSLMAGADATDYGRYRDTVGDWQNEEQQAYNRYTDAENMDYQQYINALDYWTGLAQVENADYRSEQERQEAIRQFNLQFEEDKRRYDQEWAHQLALEAAAAEAGGGGGGRRSSGDIYYKAGNTYYTVGENGLYRPVDPSTIPDSAQVDETSIGNKVSSKISQASTANQQSAAARAAAKTAANQTADKKKARLIN